MKRFQRIVRYILILLITIMIFDCFFIENEIQAAKPVEKKVIRIPCGINELLYFDRDGNVVGYCKQYLDELAKVNNWEYEYVKAGWSEAVDMLEDGRIDILFPATKLPEWEEQMAFSTLIGGYLAQGIFVANDSMYGYEDYDSFDGARIAVAKGSADSRDLAEFAQRNGFSYRPVYIASTQDKILALNEGKVDMVMFGTINEFPGTKLVSVLDVHPFYYTVKGENKQLLFELNRGMQNLLINNPDIVSEVFEDCIMGSNMNKIAFTKEELKLIADGRKIKVGFYEHTEPLAYVDSKGKSDGIFIELLEKIKEKTGLNIEPYAISRDDDWKELLKNGTIDFYIGSSDSISKKESSFICTNSFMDYKTVLVTKNDFNLNKKKRFTLALTHVRAYWDENLPKDFKDAELKYYKTARDCLIAVKRGKVDATLLNTTEFNYQTKNTLFSDLVQWENYRFGSGTSLTALDSMDPVLFSVMNKSLAVLSEDEVSNVTSSYINIPYKMTGIWDYVYPIRNVLLIIGTIFIMTVLIGIVIYKIRKKQAVVLEENKKREERQLKIMATLGIEYVLVQYVDMDADTYDVVEVSDKLRKEVVEMVKQPFSFSRGIHEYVVRFVRPEYHAVFNELFEKGAIIERFKVKRDFSVRYQVISNRQKQEYFEMHFVDISSNADEHIMVLGFRCVDEVVQEEAEQKRILLDAYETANRANHAKSDFLSKMSHDIRTPMNAIIGMTMIAKSHIDDKERIRDALHKIDSSSRHLLGLINEVLDMSKIESGKMTLNEEDFNFSDLVNNLLIMVQPQIEQHRHKLQVHICDVEHEDVCGDSLRLQQIFVNIMGNAVKYTPDGGKICLTVREKNNKGDDKFGCYEFVFEDNGIGMSREYLEHIFEPFTRAEDDRINKIQGTGLGLAIAQNIIHMMNGNIQVESEEGKGTAFTITLPLKLQVKEQKESKFEHSPVLVADEDPVFCEIICKELKKLGMDSKWVLSGTEALECVRSAKQRNKDFYAVILDLHLPVKNGLETAKEIKKLKEGPEPYIILSAYDWSDMEKQEKALEFDFLLDKPVFKSSLIKLLQKLEGREEESDNENLLDILYGDYSKRRALLVEDNVINLEIAAEVLGMTGITIEEAENGQVALEKFKASESGYYDIIFMDVQMPVMNGYESTIAIRSLNRRDAATVPIIAMTANAFAEDVKIAKNSGMNEHLAKPFDLNKLNIVLKKYFGKKNDIKK